jgi:mono/diheme cytochrome c family protein/glucose/arabinose dehydrogenase
MRINKHYYPGMKYLFKISTFILALCLLASACKAPDNIERDDANIQPVFNAEPSRAYLSPEESMKTIYLPPGYRLELVASEPMIQEPVAIAWDGNGRMYVAEMLTYMQDADASGEQEGRSRISLLEDTDNDGRMDKHSVFVDNLLLPRMLQCVNDELLVNETNTLNIYSYRDTNANGRADEKKLVYKNEKYVNKSNMEHQRSGLDWNLDNWMYLTYDPVRFRYTNGTMQLDTIVSGGGGQWGVTHDNYGRLFYSRAGAEIPALEFQINPVYGKLDFPDQFNKSFQAVWPVIATPDVQGGQKRLRHDITLNHFTAACGQSIFRGDRLPQDMVGDYIVCEPVGRLIRRAKVINDKGKTLLVSAYDNQEFISSSDMNFRPVNSATGPDGNLYIVDMHRGIIQQGNWTRPGTFLRQKIDSLGLADNRGHGRIYRVVHDEYEPGPKPTMLNESASSLVSYLNHPNGWWRDNAQKQMIALGDKSVIGALRDMATGDQSFLDKLAFWKDDPSHLARIHALWTLEGLKAIEKDVLMSALQDEHPQVRRTAIWISERYLQEEDDTMIEAVAGLKNDERYDVRVQLLLSLSKSKSERAMSIIDEILYANADVEMFAATKAALEKNETVRTFGARLGNLPAEDRRLVLDGTAIFKSLCASCHGADGNGMAIGGSEMAAPPLRGSKRLAFDDKNTAIRILLSGLTGPVDGKSYPGVMPAMNANSDEWIASVASYIRYEFGERGRRGASPAIKPEDVKKLREAHAGRNKAWTLSELEVKNREDDLKQETTLRRQ